MAWDTNRQEGDVLTAQDWNQAVQEIKSKQSRLNVVDGLDSTSSVDVLSAKQGKVLNDKITDVNTAVENVSDKIDKLPTGIYYGQYDSEEDLEDVQVTTKGYAYISSTDPAVYYIYLYDGNSWTNSGNKFVTTNLETDLSTKSQTKAPTTKVVAEGIEAIDVTTEQEFTSTQKETARTNINAQENIASMADKLPVVAALNDRAADTVLGTGEVRALGYKVLNPAMSFAEQVTDKNTVYEIKDSYVIEKNYIINQSYNLNLTTVADGKRLYYNDTLISLTPSLTTNKTISVYVDNIKVGWLNNNVFENLVNIVTSDKSVKLAIQEDNSTVVNIEGTNSIETLDNTATISGDTYFNSNTIQLDEGETIKIEKGYVLLNEDATAIITDNLSYTNNTEESIEIRVAKKFVIQSVVLRVIESLPQNVILKFNGGKLNGRIVGADTKIEGKLSHVFGKNVQIAGTWSIPVIDSDLFEDLNYDSSLKQLFNLTNRNTFNTVNIKNYGYNYMYTPLRSGIGEAYIVPNSNTVINIGGTIEVVATNFNLYDVIRINEDVKNVSIHGGHLIGTKGKEGSTAEWQHGITVKSAPTIDNMPLGNIRNQSIHIDGLHIEYFYGDGICVTNSYNVNITDVTINDCNRDGISLIGANNVEISNCIIFNITATGIDNEPNSGSFAWLPNTNITIRNNKIYDCAVGIDITSQRTEIHGPVLIENNTIQQCAEYITSTMYSNVKIWGNVFINENSTASVIYLAYASNTIIQQNTFIGSVTFSPIKLGKQVIIDGNIFDSVQLDGFSMAAPNIVVFTNNICKVFKDVGSHSAVTNILFKGNTIENGTIKAYYSGVFSDNVYKGSLDFKSSSKFSLINNRIEVHPDSSNSYYGIYFNNSEDVIIKGNVIDIVDNTLARVLVFYGSKAIVSNNLLISKVTASFTRTCYYFDFTNTSSDCKKMLIENNRIQYYTAYYPTREMDVSAANKKKMYIIPPALGLVMDNEDFVAKNKVSNIAAGYRLMDSSIFVQNNQIGVAPNVNTKYFKPFGGSTSRPTLTSSDKAYEYFDTTLNRMIIWNGTNWVDGNGETVGLQVPDTSMLIAAAQNSSKTINVYSTSAITAVSQVIDETSITYTTGSTADTIESTSYYAGSAISLNEGDIIRIDGTAVILNSSKDAIVAFTSGKSYIASGTETIYIATTTADTDVVYIKGNWLEASVGTASGSTYPVTLKALSANSTAPRGAKVIITNNSEVIIINVVQSY